MKIKTSCYDSYFDVLNKGKSQCTIITTIKVEQIRVDISLGAGDLLANIS